jgi:hypothetical protein
VLRSLVSSALFLASLTVTLPASSLFKPAKTYLSGGTHAISIAVADLNGDGKPDLVVSNGASCYTCSSGSVGVLLGNGDGTFQEARTYDTGGSGTGQIAVADLNGDGKLDVVVTNACAAGISCDGNSDTGSVAVLLGNGDGTLQTAKVFSTGNQISLYLALADFNRDGKLDVVVADGCGGCGHFNISVLIGNGDGTFGSPSSYGLDAEPLGIAAGDVNGDGKIDLLVGFENTGGNPNGSSAVLLGNGDGTFQPPQTLYPAGAYPALADVDGDGVLDLVVATPCSNPRCTKGGVGVLLGNGDGSFRPIQIYSSGDYDADYIAIGDVNRDGKADILVANYGAGPSGKVGALLGVGDGTFLPVQLSSAGIGGPFAMSLADVNSDGKPDLLVAIYDLNNEITTGGVGVLLNNTFWSTTTTLTSTPNPSIKGQAVTFKATVTSVGSVQPTGKVVFENSGTQIGSATLSGGVATLVKKNLPVGSLSITSSYKGDTKSAKSSSTALIQVVNPN